MKKCIFILFVFALLAVPTACKKNSQAQNATSLQGVWHFKNVKGGLAGIDLNYSPGDVSWYFDVSSNILQVTNNTPPSSDKNLHARFTTGTYAYSATDTSGQPRLFVNGMDIGLYTITNSTLVINDGFFADGFLTELSR